MSGTGDNMKIDRLLNDIQTKLVEVTMEIQRLREQRLRQSPTLRQRKEMVLEETCHKLAKVFKELGYEKTD